MAKATQHGARIYLDLSRLLSAGRRRTPSGIERVELAYAKRFGSAEETRFVVFFLRGLHFVPAPSARAYIAAVERAWQVPGKLGRAKAMVRMACLYFLLLAIALRGLVRARATAGETAAVYLSLSHETLTAHDAISRFKARGAKLVCFVHDLIPISHPEYARPRQSAVHRRRMDNVAALADAVLVNSQATQAALLRYLGARPIPPKIHVLHLGINSIAIAPIVKDNDPAAKPPYFIILATIEPRKNHLLLLNLWRLLAVEPGAAPRLIIAGRRGWENEMVIDMLERCEAIAGIVEERRDVRDDELGALLRGARALLLPSFAEGYGLPVAEALAAGTPVICSDLPALREIGGDVPEYLDPLDGPAWHRAILDYTNASSPRRIAQCERMHSWQAPCWDRHFEQLSAVLEGLFEGGQ